MINVLFVCLGNICRSPIAEGVFRKLVEQEKLEGSIGCDSAGTAGYHIGELPDRRMRNTAGYHGLTLEHKARQLITTDFHSFDYIIAMDSANKRNILRLSEESVQEEYAEILMMRQFDKANPDSDVPDPYYGGIDGFEEVYQIVERCSMELLQFLKEKHTL